MKHRILIAITAALCVLGLTAPAAMANASYVESSPYSQSTVAVFRSCSGGYVYGASYGLKPGYHTTYYTGGFVLGRQNAKVYRNGVYIYTAIGPHHLCFPTGDIYLLIINK